MTRSPDSPCKQCGRLLWRRSGTPRGTTTCRDCQRANPYVRTPVIRRCTQCHAPTATPNAQLCDVCRPPVQPCAWCDTPMTMVGQRRTRRYCSRTCQNTHLQRTTVVCDLQWHQCAAPTCVRWVARPGRRYCTDTCRQQRRAATDSRPRHSVCVDCGVPIDPGPYRKRCDHCATQRATENYQARMANLKALRAAGLLDGGNHRQRARKFGVSYEYINPLTVYTRDEWTCRLCHQPIDPHATFPHPHSASLDHAVPISRGGPHTYDNVQAAHLRCNIRKAAIMPEPTEEPSTEGDTETRHDHRRTRLAKPTPRTVEASGHHGTSHRRG